MRKMIGILLLCAAIFTLGCGTVTSVNYTPINNLGVERIAVIGVQNATLGAIGQHHEGVFALPSYSWVIGSNVNATFPVVVTDILRNELTMAGYDAINMTNTMLTSAMEENITLSIGSTITTIKADTYNIFCGNKATSEVTIRFEVTCLQSGTQVFIQTYSGSAQAAGEDPMSAITMAAQNAIRAFLADELAAQTLAGI